MSQTALQKKRTSHDDSKSSQAIISGHSSSGIASIYSHIVSLALKISFRSYPGGGPQHHCGR